MREPKIVFQMTYSDKQGQKRTSRNWWVRFNDHLGIERRLPAFSDKAASKKLGQRLNTLAAMRAAGELPDLATAKWLENLPQRIKKRLAEFAMLDERAVAAGKPIRDHIDDFSQSLLDKGTSTKHAGLVKSRVVAALEGCNFKFWSDLSPSRLQRYLAGLREAKDGISIRTSNFYLAAVKQFCKWMVADGRASSSPFEHLRGGNPKSDLRHARRALEHTELCSLLYWPRGKTAVSRVGWCW